MKRILFVEDDEFLARIYSQYFTLCGYQSDCATAKEEALALASRNRYDVVFADVRLRDLNDKGGIEVARQVRTMQPATRLYLLTAAGDPGIMSEARDAGVEKCLFKPIPLDNLRRLIEEMP
jgi:two-component system, NarL family, sensor histidine kinase EvgS